MKQEFSAIIQKHANIDGAYVLIPFDVQAVFGARRVKVIATFDGAPYRGSIVRMGGSYLLGMTRQIRQTIQKDFGDSVKVIVEKDELDRVVEIPDDFVANLNQNDLALEFWQTLSFSSQKEYADWILSAKREETRKLRIEKAMAMLAEHTRLKG